MKKILIMLTVFGLIHFSAKAQVGTGTNHDNNANLNQGNQGQKIEVVTGIKKAATTNQSATHTGVHANSAHKATAYHKTVHHATTHHSYAKTGMHHTTAHKTTHTVAMHTTVKHTYSAHYKKPTHTAYSANKANMYSGAAGKADNNTTTTKPPVDNAKNQNAAVNRKIPDTPYPGASNGGWSNGTNGKGGTNTEDGTIKTDKRDH